MFVIELRHLLMSLQRPTVLFFFPCFLKGVFAVFNIVIPMFLFLFFILVLWIWIILPFAKKKERKRKEKEKEKAETSVVTANGLSDNVRHNNN